MPPKVTVIIPTFNRAEYLAECLESLFHQTLSPFQVIVVNDGSSDQTRETLKPYLDSIDYLETSQSGKSIAINRGLEITKGDYVWVFDDDDTALPDALERFSEPLEANPHYGFSYSSYFLAANREDGRIGEVIGESRIPDLQPRGFLIPLLEGNFLGGAALFARTTCYHRVGSYDPALVRSQDYEMAIRIARQFRGIRVQGGATFFYRQHTGLRGNMQDRFEFEERPDKWLQYDQLFFRRLFRELPLHEYLPAGYSLEVHGRQAYLQRMRVMASKLLIAEVMEDLHFLLQLQTTADYTSQERQLVGNLLFKYPYYQTGSIYDSFPEFSGEIRRLASTSHAVKQLRREIVRASISHLTEIKRWGKPKDIYSMILRTSRLF